MYVYILTIVRKIIKREYIKVRLKFNICQSSNHDFAVKYGEK